MARGNYPVLSMLFTKAIPRRCVAQGCLPPKLPKIRQQGDECTSELLTIPLLKAFTCRVALNMVDFIRFDRNLDNSEKGSFWCYYFCIIPTTLRVSNFNLVHIFRNSIDICLRLKFRRIDDIFLLITGVTYKSSFVCFA